MADSTSIRQASRSEYQARINRVLDYIERNIAEPLSLEELADVANFSKYHFHRIFATMTGETLFHFIQRVRLEKAATLLLIDRSAAVTSIGYDCGFASPQSFAKSFKDRYGVSATEWRRRNSNSGEAQRNSAKAGTNAEVYVEYGLDSHRWRFVTDYEERTVEVKALPTRTVAYVRHVGPYMGDGDLFARLWRRLAKWAGPRGLLSPETTEYLTVYHDNPDITDHEKLRISVCITVPNATVVSGVVGRMELSGGKYAIGHFSLGEKDYGEAWGWMYATWLPESGYAPDDRPSFERYPVEAVAADCTGGFGEKRPVDICIPVRPL